MPGEYFPYDAQHKTPVDAGTTYKYVTHSSKIEL